MKKILVVLIVLVSSVSWADLTESDYNDMTTKIDRLHASAEVRAEFRGFITDLKARRARILTYKNTIGNADATIPAGYVDTATSFYVFLGTALNQAETNYKVFLTGDDGED